MHRPSWNALGTRGWSLENARQMMPVAGAGGKFTAFHLASA